MVTGTTFADAAAEWLRYVEHDRMRKASTVGTYRALLRSQILPAFAELPIEASVARADRDGCRCSATGHDLLSLRDSHATLATGTQRVAECPHRSAGARRWPRASDRFVHSWFSRGRRHRRRVVRAGVRRQSTTDLVRLTTPSVLDQSNPRLSP